MNSSNETSSAYCIAGLSLKVESFFRPHFLPFAYLSPALPPFHLAIKAPLPSGHQNTVTCVNELYIYDLWLHLLSPRPPTLFPSESCQSVMYPCLCFYFAIFFCSLDSTYKWDHMVSVFLWLTYSLSIKSSGPSRLLQKVRFPSFSGWAVFNYVNITRLFSSTHLLVGTLAVSAFWLLQIMLQWA